MTPERWAQVKHVLYAVLDLQPELRSRYLDEACADDRCLRDEVESFVLSHAQIEPDFLPTIANDSGFETVQPKLPLVGRMLGQYKVVQEIGSGGMGEVYRAVRADDQYDREVAIKVMRWGFHTESALRRFKAERQILASLSHPNIAGLLDSGTTEDHVPYVVMELVHGSPIDEYCTLHRLPLVEQLQLFRQVCTAVQYAHQHLIVHRDLKPGNILVTEEGVPKLLDFGIAKLLAPESLASLPQATATLTQAMTPEFASPEQVRGETITTASDVYSLGVVLYRLLTGTSPYRLTSETSHEIAHHVCETEPQKPSLAITRSESNIHGWEGSKASFRAHIKHRLAGDLDNIVLMALRKEPERRYGSVAQLSDDIRRHLEGLPVIARHDTFSYRAGKFMSRHKAALAAAALFVVMLLVGVVAIVREARIARAERARAEKRLEDVRQFSDALIFDIHDAVQKLPGSTPVRKLLLDRAVQYLDSVSNDASGNPQLQRELALAYQRLSTVQGDTSQANLGEVSAAEVSTRKAMALFEGLARANPNNPADQLNLAMAYRSRAFYDIFEVNGRNEIEQALALTDPLMTSDGNNLKVMDERSLEYYILAEALDAAGDRLQATDAYRKHRELLQQIARRNPAYPEVRRRLAKASVRLGYHLVRTGSDGEGMLLLNEGINDYQALVKEDGSPELKRELNASSKGRRGIAYLMLGNVPAARADFQSAADTIAFLLKVDPKNAALQSDFVNLNFEDARAIAVGGRYPEALKALEVAFRQFQALNTTVYSGVGSGGMLAWVGEAQAATHHFQAALKSFQKSAAILAADQGNYDDARCDLAMVQTKMGSVLLRMGKLPEAASEFNKALNTANLSFSIQHMDLPSLYAAADAYSGMGNVEALEAAMAATATERGRLREQARSSYENSLNVWKRIPHPSRINGNEFFVGDSKEVEMRLAALLPSSHRAKAH
jgi:serine/threonine protein kinase/tetratricopeptide (TPR) repeat protein